MRKLKYSEIKEVREALLQKQNGLCRLCNEPISPGEEVLDHEHSSGRIRSTLHRGCNAYLGKLENNLARNRITPARLNQICANLLDYLATSEIDLLHPTHGRKKKRGNKNKQNMARKRRTLNIPVSGTKGE